MKKILLVLIVIIFTTSIYAEKFSKSSFVDKQIQLTINQNINNLTILEYIEGRI